MEEYRLNYNLNENSIAFDLGGYKGQWSQAIYDKFKCSIFCFEIIPEYIANLKTMFSDVPKIKIFPYGLSTSTKHSVASKINDSSSLYKGELTEQISLVDICDFIDHKTIQHIDLMKINIEGSEYDLLDHMLNHTIVNKIDNIQVQFHSFYPNAHKRMKTIQDRLLKTHKVTYQIPFVWENWELKK